MPLPRSVIFVKVQFLKGLEDMSQNFLQKSTSHKIVRGAGTKTTLTLYVISLIDAILFVMSSFITEQCILAIECNPLFSSLQND